MQSSSEFWTSESWVSYRSCWAILLSWHWPGTHSTTVAPGKSCNLIYRKFAYRLHIYIQYICTHTYCLLIVSCSKTISTSFGTLQVVLMIGYLSSFDSAVGGMSDKKVGNNWLTEILKKKNLQNQQASALLKCLWARNWILWSQSWFLTSLWRRDKWRHPFGCWHSIAETHADCIGAYTSFHYSTCREGPNRASVSSQSTHTSTHFTWHTDATVLFLCYFVFKGEENKERIKHICFVPPPRLSPIGINEHLIYI